MIISSQRRLEQQYNDSELQRSPNESQRVTNHGQRPIEQRGRVHQLSSSNMTPERKQGDDKVQKQSGSGEQSDDSNKKRRRGCGGTQKNTGGVLA